MVTPPDPESVWQTFGATARGALHVQRGLPNQDSHAFSSGERRGGLVLAVADGHGDSRCVRADVGARLAVGAATRSALLLYDEPESAPGAPDPALLAAQLVEATVHEWQSAVDRHLEQHPGRPGEHSLLDPVRGGRMAYGTTLLLALVTEPHLVFVQIGDGDILMVRAGGTTAHPVASRAPLVGGETLSLAADDPVACAAMSVVELDDDIRLLLLATDGYANSFAEADWDATIGIDYLRLLGERGPAWMAASLPKWVDASAQAAGDDVTVLVTVRA